MDYDQKFFLLCNPFFILRHDRVEFHDEYRRWLAAKPIDQFEEIFERSLRLIDPFPLFMSERSQTSGEFLAENPQ